MEQRLQPSFAIVVPSLERREKLSVDRSVGDGLGTETPKPAARVGNELKEWLVSFPYYRQAWPREAQAHQERAVEPVGLDQCFEAGNTILGPVRHSLHKQVHIRRGAHVEAGIDADQAVPEARYDVRS